MAEGDERNQLAGDEPGDIGDEQMPAGEIKTDKAEWNYAANKIKKDSILPESVRRFLDGL